MAQIFGLTKTLQQILQIFSKDQRKNYSKKYRKYDRKEQTERKLKQRKEPNGNPRTEMKNLVGEPKQLIGDGRKKVRT